MHGGDVGQVLQVGELVVEKEVGAEHLEDVRLVDAP